jgi:hypothetical protein
MVKVMMKEKESDEGKGSGRWQWMWTERLSWGGWGGSLYRRGEDRTVRPPSSEQ